jgi:hypothetical protein
MKLRSMQVLLLAAWAVVLYPMPLAASDAVAYVERYFPAGDLGHVIRVERDGRTLRVSGTKLDLAAGDKIFITDRDALVVVRYIANNVPVEVRQNIRTATTDQADLTVGQSSLPGLTDSLRAWLEDQLTTASQQTKRRPVASRGVAVTSVCYNETGRTDDPIAFDVPVFQAQKSQIAAGIRSVFVSWQGGAQPYSVSLADAETNRVISELTGIKNSCATYLPTVDLKSGQYRLTVTDANNVKEEESNLFVVDASPQMPAPLLNAKLPDEARELYFATWLAAIDGGTWAFESQQQVARMNCHSAPVQDWLRRWGTPAPCI